MRTAVLPMPRGGTRKLTREQVLEARRMCREKTIPPLEGSNIRYSGVAAHFGVSIYTMYQALAGKGAYADIPRKSWGDAFRTGSDE